jgi:hypothetical protein
VSPDGAILAAAMCSKGAGHQDAPWEEAVSCLSIGDGRVLGTATIGWPRFVRAVAFSPSGEFVMCAHAGGISIFTAPKLDRCYFLDRRGECGLGNIRDAAFSADGRHAAIIEPKRRPAPWEASPAIPPGSSGCSPGGVDQIAGERDGAEITLVELRTKQPCWQLSRQDYVCNPALSADGGMLAFQVLARGAGRVEIWDTCRGKRIARLDNLPQQLVYAFVPNSDILAVLKCPSSLLFLSVPSCQQLGSIEHAGITVFSLSSEGQSLAIGDEKNSVEIWDLQRGRLRRRGTRSQERPSATREPSQAELSGWCDAIGGSDARAARKGMEGLEDSGDRGIEFLETRLKPETVGETEILAMVRELDSSEFRVRQGTLKKLEPLARIAKGQLREQMEASKSAEVRAGLRRVLAAAEDYCIRDPECLRCLRAIECLEVIGSSRSRRLLTRLAGGSPSSPVTQDASAALVRMDEWVSAD